jgi:hypothetical protein
MRSPDLVTCDFDVSQIEDESERKTIANSVWQAAPNSNQANHSRGDFDSGSKYTFRRGKSERDTSRNRVR